MSYAILALQPGRKAMTGREDLFNEALAESPESPNALISVALALLETGQLEEELIVYQRVATLMPEDPVPVEKSAEVLERLGKLQQSVQRREDAAALDIRRKAGGKE